MFELLKSVMSEALQLNVNRIRPNTSLEDAGLDSLAVVELSMTLNQHHNIEITDDELLELNTIAEIVALMEQRKQTAT